MAQLFRPSANIIAKSSVVIGLIAVAGLGLAIDTLFRSPYNTNVKIARDQPVPFSHKHHVAQLGIDCRYCHTAVEKSASAGLPPTKTCMNCHSQIWVGSKMLAPVRESYKTGGAIEWKRVHKLGDFCYFNHSIHVQKGVGCVTCHGRVDQMPLVWQENTLLMEWCLDCHRQPAKYVRPREEVFNMTYERKDPTEGERLVQEYQIKSKMSCNACHR